MAKLPPQPLGVAPGSSYWNDWYEKLRAFVEKATTSIDWNAVINKPTTLVGYGITDGVTPDGTLGGSTLMVGNGTSHLTSLGDLGTSTTVLHGNAAGLPSWGKVVLTTDVSGVLPTANGGAAGLTVVITTAKLTAGGTNGSMSFVNGLLTAQTAAT